MRAIESYSATSYSCWMEEPGEQCTVVFALIVTEQATEGVFREGGGLLQPSPPPPSTRFRNNLCKDDSALFSRFLHVHNSVTVLKIFWRLRIIGTAALPTDLLEHRLGLGWPAHNQAPQLRSDHFSRFWCKSWNAASPPHWFRELLWSF